MAELELEGEAAMEGEVLVAVGVTHGAQPGSGTWQKRWQTPDRPAPTIRAGWSGDGGPGWILTRERQGVARG